MLTLKDTSVITLDKMPPTLVQKTKEYLEKLKQAKTSKYTSTYFTLLSVNSTIKVKDGNQRNIVLIRTVRLMVLFNIKSLFFCCSFSCIFQGEVELVQSATVLGHNFRTFSRDLCGINIDAIQSYLFIKT